MTKKWIVWVALVLALSSLAHAQTPDAATIQLAMNESLELEFPYFQEFAGVQVTRGGATDEGDYLFLCDARLIWKVRISPTENIPDVVMNLDQRVVCALDRTGDVVLPQKLAVGVI